MKVAELERRCDMYERVLREIASGGIIVCNDEEEDERDYIYAGICPRAGKECACPLI